MFIWFNNLSIYMQAMLACIFTWLFTLIGTSLIFLFKDIKTSHIKCIYAISSGLLLSSSIYVLFNPSINDLNKYLVFLLVVIGAGFIIFIERLFINKNNKSLKILVAMMIHNIPEGLAVGISYSAFSKTNLTKSNIIFFVLAIAIQNIPDGLAVSLPLKLNGKDNKYAFKIGLLTSLLEPIFGIIGIIFCNKLSLIISKIYAFSFGALFYIVIDDLIPSSHEENNYYLTMLIIISFLSILFSF